MQIESTNNGVVNLKKGDEFTLVTIRYGNHTEYEVYGGNSFKNEMANWLNDYQLIEPTLLNYMLLRMRWMKIKVDIRVVDCTIDEDDNLIETSYATEVCGTYKNRTFKGSISDDYWKYLDDDNIKE